MLSAWSPVSRVKSIAARSPPLCATGLCAGEQVHLADRPVDDERLQRLLRAPGRGGEAGRLLVGELDARRGLLVGELEVGQLAHVCERAAPVGAARPARSGISALPSAAPSRTTGTTCWRLAGERRVAARRIGARDHPLERRVAGHVREEVPGLRRGAEGPAAPRRAIAADHQPRRRVPSVDVPRIVRPPQAVGRLSLSSATVSEESGPLTDRARAPPRGACEQFVPSRSSARSPARPRAVWLPRKRASGLRRASAAMRRAACDRRGPAAAGSPRPAR